MAATPPLHRTIAAELRHRIRSGSLAVGRSLPSESRLCEEFSASRGPVRQALATLRDEGLIGGGQGRRAVVLDTVPTQPFESFLSFTRRAELTGYSPGQRLQEIALRRPEPEIAAALQIGPDDLAVQLVRLRLLDGRPAMLERMTYVESLGRPLISADLDAGSIYALLTEQEWICTRPGTPSTPYRPTPWTRSCWTSPRASRCSGSGA